MSAEPGGTGMPPQQAMVPSVFSPHAYSTPALTELNVPVGGAVSPPKLLPQQAMEPSVLTPQAN
jgi:hypothetical protein